MGMLMSFNPVLISHIIQGTFSEFEIDRHYYTSSNQKEEPPTTSFSRSERLPENIFAIYTPSSSVLIR
jgi:hypothetical protein